MSKSDGVLPPHLERELNQMGVFNDDLEDDPTLNTRPKLGPKEDRNRNRHEIPDIEFDPETGEPNF